MPHRGASLFFCIPYLICFWPSHVIQTSLYTKIQKPPTRPSPPAPKLPRYEVRGRFFEVQGARYGDLFRGTRYEVRDTRIEQKGTLRFCVINKRLCVRKLRPAMQIRIPPAHPKSLHEPEKLRTFATAIASAADGNRPQQPRTKERGGLYFFNQDYCLIQ